MREQPVAPAGGLPHAPGSQSLLSHLINTNVRCMRLFQWFYDVELCMDMNTSYNNTNRLSPLPPGEGQGEGV